MAQLLREINPLADEVRRLRLAGARIDQVHGLEEQLREKWESLRRLRLAQRPAEPPRRSGWDR